MRIVSLKNKFNKIYQYIKNKQLILIVSIKVDKTSFGHDLKSLRIFTMKLHMEKFAFGLTFSLVSFAAISAPINLVNNGSFENGFAGWSSGGSAGTPAPAVIFYNNSGTYPDGAFGESVPPANNTTLSPDAAGTRAAYFASDSAVNSSLQQSIFLTAGTYRIGFDVYATKNGYNQPGDASFSAQIAGITLADYFVSTEPAGTWTNYSGLANIQSDGEYLISFIFNTPDFTTSKDVVLDRVYIIESDEQGGTIISKVPEPTSLALFGLGFLGLLGVKSRKSERKNSSF